MATQAQQSSPAIALPMLVKKLTSYIMSYPPLSVASPKHNVLVIDEYLNARTSKRVNHKFSLHLITNNQF